LLDLNKAVSFNANLHALCTAEERVFRLSDLTKVARKLHNSRWHVELMRNPFTGKLMRGIVDRTIQNCSGSFLLEAALQVKTTAIWGFSEILSPR
jgi:hypothetical protein